MRLGASVCALLLPRDLTTRAELSNTVPCLSLLSWWKAVFLLS